MTYIYYTPKQKDFKDRKLIRADGITVPYNEILAKMPGFFPYEEESDKAVEFDIEWAGKKDCVTFAKENFGVDLPINKSLAYLRTQVKELCRSQLQK